MSGTLICDYCPDFNYKEVRRTYYRWYGDSCDMGYGSNCTSFEQLELDAYCGKKLIKEDVGSQILTPDWCPKK